MKLFRKAGEWLSDLIGGGSQGTSLWFGMPTYSGKVVTPENSLQCSAIFAAIKILAETESSLPMRVYARAPDGSTGQATDHPVDALLHDEPNPEMSAIEFRMSQMAQLALWGNCYSRIARNASGQVIALWPLMSKAMQVKRDARGELDYEYTISGGTPAHYQAADILHVRTLSYDGIHGISPIAQLPNPIGLAMALEEYASRFFGNGAIPAVALEYPERLSPEAIRNIQSSWKNMYGGTQHAHEVAVLEEGMKLQQIGAKPIDTQAIEARKFQINEVCRVFRIPPHMLSDLERSTFSNIEQQSLEFVIYTLMPWLVLWEQACNRVLFTAAEKKKYFVEHNVAGLLRGDLDSRYRAYATARQWGWLSVNDVRKSENMNPIGPKGEDYLVPLNMTPAGTPVPLPADAKPANPTAKLSAAEEEQEKATALRAAIFALASMSARN